MILYLNIIWKFLSVRWFCQSLVPLHHQHIDVSKGPAQQQIWYNFDFTSCENIGSMLKEWMQWPQWGERACYYLSFECSTVIHTFYVQLHQDCWLSCPSLVLSFWQLSLCNSIQHIFAEVQNIYCGIWVIFSVCVVAYNPCTPLL